MGGLENVSQGRGGEFGSPWWLDINKRYQNGKSLTSVSLQKIFYYEYYLSMSNFSILQSYVTTLFLVLFHCTNHTFNISKTQLVVEKMRCLTYWTSLSVIMGNNLRSVNFSTLDDGISFVISNRSLICFSRYLTLSLWSLSRRVYTLEVYTVSTAKLSHYFSNKWFTCQTVFVEKKTLLILM